MSVNLQKFFINHWALFIALIITVVIIILNEIKIQKNLSINISSYETVTWINHKNAHVLDIRDKKDFYQEHIINSKNIDISSFHKNDIEKYKNIPIIIVCSNGNNSLVFAERLKKFGLYNIRVLSGGITTWKANNFPTIKINNNNN